jgi:hypothetical protein
MRGWFSGQSFESISRAITQERCVNLIPQIVPPAPQAHASATMIFYGVPGILARCNIGPGPIRQIYYSNGRCFAVSGSQLWEIYANYDGIYRGEVGTDGKPALIESNRFQLCITSANSTFIYDLATNTLVNINVPLIQARFADGYFLGVTPDSQMIRISGQYDGLLWDPLDFASAEAAPDNIVSVLCDHREVWTFGAEVTEVWADTGAQLFPFDRIPGATIEQGCAAQNSPAKLDNSVFWLGSDSRGQGIVWRATGYTPQRVSNHALEYQLSLLPTLSDCIGYAYQDQGQTFYVMTFPAGDKTFVYDCSTTLFHERASWDPAGAKWHRQRAQCHSFAFGKHLVGDKDNGNIHEQSINFYTDNGAAQKWLRSVPIGFNENKYLFPRNLELDIEEGKGLSDI